MLINRSSSPPPRSALAITSIDKKKFLRCRFSLSFFLLLSSGAFTIIFIWIRKEGEDGERNVTKGNRRKGIRQLIILRQQLSDARFTFSLSASSNPSVPAGKRREYANSPFTNLNNFNYTSFHPPMRPLCVLIIISSFAYEASAYGRTR